MSAADDLCRCGHERKWHASCSRCGCPWFLPAGAPRSILAAWKADSARLAERTARLTGRAAR